ncbi:MAG: hypothetical protein AABZ39_00220 [Spirochaetota bacterium]
MERTKAKRQIIVRKGQRLYDKIHDAFCKVIWTVGDKLRIRHDRAKVIVTEDADNVMHGREFLILSKGEETMIKRARISPPSPRKKK